MWFLRPTNLAVINLPISALDNWQSLYEMQIDNWQPVCTERVVAGWYRENNQPSDRVSPSTVQHGYIGSDQFHGPTLSPCIARFSSPLWLAKTANVDDDDAKTIKYPLIWRSNMSVRIRSIMSLEMHVIDIMCRFFREINSPKTQHT